MMKTAIIISGVLGLALLALFNCGPKSPTGSGGKVGFAVHEWGVLVGCAGDTAGFVTSRPEYPSLVREPVIYVHKQDKIPFSVRAIFHVGQPSATYPTAQINGDTVAWPVIDFVPWVRAAASADTSDFVPLEEIVDQLNDVDADMLYLGANSARFLFYEGFMPTMNLVTATPLPEDTSVIFANAASYTVYDLAYSTNHPAALGPLLLLTAYIDSLAPGQSDTVRIQSGTTISFAEQLGNLGFTLSEAEAFATLWEPSFYESMEAVEAQGNLMYRLPQDAYDALIALEVDPQPEEVVRALYVLNHIYEQVPTD